MKVETPSLKQTEAFSPETLHNILWFPSIHLQHIRYSQYNLFPHKYYTVYAELLKVKVGKLFTDIINSQQDV